MANLSLVPSLSEDGWVKDPLKAGDLLLSYFFTSDFSQTSIYLNNVSSLPYLVQKYGQNITNLCSEVSSSLSMYLNRYFTNAIAECQEHANPLDSSNTGIDLYVSYVGHDNKTYTMAKILSISNSKLINVINANNY